MTAKVLDGVATAAAIKTEVRQRVEALKAEGVNTGLGTLLVGGDPASASYVKGKHRDCAEVGIESIRVELPATASTADVRAAIADLNSAPEVTGFIVQLPLPDGLDGNEALDLIDPAKDADGLHPYNLGKLVQSVSGKLETPLPATPHGIVQLAERNGIELSGKTVAIVGRGLTVGRPLGLLLTRRGIDATVVLAHSRTTDLAGAVRQADIVVAAVGSPHLVTAEMIKPGAAVFDVGITRARINPNGKATLLGDAHPDVAEVAGHLTPVPGGVGPMTRAMLLVNVVEAAGRIVGSRA